MSKQKKLSDFEKWKKFLESFNIKYSDYSTEDKKLLRTESGYSKVTGYLGFFTEFEFTIDGKFIQMGAWE